MWGQMGMQGPPWCDHRRCFVGPLLIKRGDDHGLFLGWGEIGLCVELNDLEATKWPGFSTPCAS